MCRSIQTLRGVEPPPTDGEVAAAALQFVRKVSGYRVPSRANAEAFDRAVAEVAEASQRLLDALGTPVAAGPAPARPRSATPRVPTGAAG